MRAEHQGCERGQGGSQLAAGVRQGEYGGGGGGVQARHGGAADQGAVPNHQSEHREAGAAGEGRRSNSQGGVRAPFTCDSARLGVSPVATLVSFSRNACPWDVLQERAAGARAETRQHEKKKTAEQAVVRRCAVSLRAPHPSDLTLPWKFRLRCGRAHWMVQGWSYTTGLLYDGAVWNDASAPPGQWRRAAWVGQLRLTEWSHPTGGVPDWVCGHACQPRRFPSRGEDMRGGLCDPPAVLSPQG
jgi:hypothetical protein